MVGSRHRVAGRSIKNQLRAPHTAAPTRVKAPSTATGIVGQYQMKSAPIGQA
jgi:hypothetical protein